MRILVIGNTAQAAWLTSRLHQLNTNVQWWTESATASFTIQHGATTTTVENLPLTTDLATALEPAPDWIIMATAGWQIDSLGMIFLQTFPMGKYPKFLCLTHGIGPTAKLRHFFGDQNVLRGVLGATMRWSGEKVLSEGELGIVFSQSELAERLGVLAQENLWGGAVSFADDKALAWSDVLWQLQANALPSILDVEPVAIYDNPEYWAIEYQQLQEALTVIRHEGFRLVALPGVNVPRLVQMIRWLPQFLLKKMLKAQATYPTLRDDLDNATGRSDAAYINGAVAYAGHEAGLPIPINHALAVTLTDIAEGRARWSQYQGDLTQLATIIRIMSRH